MAKGHKAFRTVLENHEDDTKDVGAILNNITSTSVCAKLRGEYPFTLKEIFALCDHYNIPLMDIAYYFPPKGIPILTEPPSGDFSPMGIGTPLKKVRAV